MGFQHWAGCRRSGLGRGQRGKIVEHEKRSLVVAADGAIHVLYHYQIGLAFGVLGGGVNRRGHSVGVGRNSHAQVERTGRIALFGKELGAEVLRRSARGISAFQQVQEIIGENAAGRDADQSRIVHHSLAGGQGEAPVHIGSGAVGKYAVGIRCQRPGGVHGVGQVAGHHGRSIVTAAAAVHGPAVGIELGTGYVVKIVFEQ